VGLAFAAITALIECLESDSLKPLLLASFFLFQAACKVKAATRESRASVFVFCFFGLPACYTASGALLASILLLFSRGQEEGLALDCID
jgi:hypothetical protein